MSSYRFTFCIPNLNKIKYLPACIESMLSQDCPTWKCIFVDGYSTDGSWEYMQQFASDPRFMLLRGRQKGMYEDWNECLQHVDTEYFYFLTSDDTCFPELVSTSIAALDAYPDVDVCHFQFSTIDRVGNTIYMPEQIIQEQFDLYQQVNYSAHRRDGICEVIMHFVYGALYRTITSLVFRKKLLIKMKEFSSQYGSFGDYDWTMRLGLFTDILYIPKLLATWRVYEGQATQDLESAQNRKRLLDVATSNLVLLERMGKSSLLKKPLDRHSILFRFFEGLAASKKREILKTNSFRSLLFQWLLFIKNHPWYLVTRAIKILSRGRFYSVPHYFQRKERAQKVINEYGLSWPPKPILFPTTAISD